MAEPLAAQVKIMILSDHPEIADSWIKMLQGCGMAAWRVDFSPQGLARRAEERPDLLLMECHSCNAQNLQLIKNLRQETLIPILLFTPQADEASLLEAYTAGVDEAIAQPIGPGLFIAKAQAWLRRTQSLEVDELQVGEMRLNLRERLLVLPGARQVRLSHLEARLLVILMSHPGQVLRTAELVERVWGYYQKGDSMLLKNLVYRLRRKIEPNPSQPCLLCTEADIGYRFQA